MDVREFFNYRDVLLEVASNTHNHMLDRIDAYLELALLLETDNPYRAKYVQQARDLIAEDFDK